MGYWTRAVPRGARPDAYVPAPDRYERMPYRRCGRSGLAAAGDLARPVAELRRRPPAAEQPRDAAPGVRPRHHALRPRQQLRAALRQRRDQLRADLRRGLPAATATSSSSRRRRARTCGPGPMASGARASTCSASLDQSLTRMRLDHVDIFYSHRFDPEHAAEETMGALDTAVRPGQGALCRDLLLRSAAHRGGGADPARTRHPAADPSALLLDAEPLDRGRPARRARARGRRRDRVLAACAGPADRPLPGRDPGRTRACARGNCFSEDLVTEENLDRVRALNEIAGRRGQTLAQLAIAWALRDPRVTSALLGASSVAQLEQNVAALERLDFTASSRRSTATPRRAGSTCGRRRAARRVAGGGGSTRAGCTSPGRRRTANTH